MKMKIQSIGNVNVMTGNQRKQNSPAFGHNAKSSMAIVPRPLSIKTSLGNLRRFVANVKNRLFPTQKLKESHALFASDMREIGSIPSQSSLAEARALLASDMREIGTASPRNTLAESQALLASDMREVGELPSYLEYKNQIFKYPKH